MWQTTSVGRPTEDVAISPSNCRGSRDGAFRGRGVWYGYGGRSLSRCEEWRSNQKNNQFRFLTSKHLVLRDLRCCFMHLTRSKLLTAREGEMRVPKRDRQIESSVTTLLEEEGNTRKKYTKARKPSVCTSAYWGFALQLRGHVCLGNCNLDRRTTRPGNQGINK